MESHAPKVHHLKHYKSPDYMIDTAFLHFDLHEDHTLVKAILNFRKNPLLKNSDTSSVQLDGENMELISISLDGKMLNADQYRVDKKELIIFNVPDTFALETEVKIKPQGNKSLSGLYKTGKNFCTQCESHGFRRITYFLDRPDVLTRFTTTISADRARYPILLSNGNLTDSHELPHDRHWVKWEDPTYKPSYLFALVAGDLDVLEDIFITQSGRTVRLAIYVEFGKREQAVFAMTALKDAMRWDEEKYGREYDLDIYMIVAVSDFNFGAMENKGLNIFNDKYILAKPETATDDDFVGVQTVVAHEYFHNWSGNRVTVRDWFQITLKEGLTVFREQQFSGDMNSQVAQRIHDAKAIRNAQFTQDAGPMAHPIQPDSYIEVNNFYTVTVYDKGAEVIRMLHTLLGPKIFRKAMDLYFAQNDGQPVTVKEFVDAMENASGIDFTQFRKWYKQSGTPILTITDSYDAAKQTYTLNITQSCLPTPDQAQKEAMHIPFAIGLLNADGREIPLHLKEEALASKMLTRVLHLRQETENFEFTNVPVKPIPSLLRNFSAPVKLQYNYSDEDLIFLMSYDSDHFNRWEASQQLATRILLSLIKQHKKKQHLSAPQAYLNALQLVFSNKQLEAAVIAEILTLPSENYLLEQMEVIDVDAIHTIREWLKKHIALALRDQFAEFYLQHKKITAYRLDAKAMGQRRLKNLCLMYLADLGDGDIYRLCLEQFYQANNMTDVMGATTALLNVNCAERTEALTAFYHRWHEEALVVYKWFTLQATSTLPDTLKVVRSLTQHEAYDEKNPNCVRSLIGAFCNSNLVQFHQINGEGYAFLTDQVLKIDRFNPQLAARMAEPLIHWKKFDYQRQLLMKAQLQRILTDPKLSNDVYEIISKSLEIKNPQLAEA